MFYDPAQFEFTPALERNWQAVRDEYLGVRRELEDWVEKKLYDQDWQALFLYSFVQAEPQEQNIARCPFTASLVHEAIPTHALAAFSRFNQTTVKPHCGYQGDFLRIHLPLVVPAGDVALKVGGEVREWEPGKVLVFDDRVEHEAWNRTGQDRVVLIVDFVPDPSVYD